MARTDSWNDCFYSSRWIQHTYAFKYSEHTAIRWCFIKHTRQVFKQTGYELDKLLLGAITVNLLEYWRKFLCTLFFLLLFLIVSFLAHSPKFCGLSGLAWYLHLILMQFLCMLSKLMLIVRLERKQTE